MADSALEMKTVVVASRNPVKVEAARRGFERMFPGERFQVDGISVESGVRHQPMTDEETRRGAWNRARAAARRQPQADFWVGIEGGIEDDGRDMYAFAWLVVHAAANGTASGTSRSAAFLLPPAIATLVRQGTELGVADDLVFERSNSKQKDGAIGILTGGSIDRAELYEHALVMALIPFRNEALFSQRTATTS